MSTKDFSCPTCEEEFDTDHGMKVHHKLEHGESIAVTELTCKSCGETFEAYQSWLDGEDSRGQYCSNECYEKDRNVSTKCSSCGGEMEVERNRYETHRHVFCSTACELKWRKERFSGETHPQYEANWNRDAYGSMWEKRRQEVLERDNYRCQRCGVTQFYHVEVYGFGLDVHHETPLKEFSDLKKAHHMDNLVVLCRTCHTKEDK